MRHSLLFYSLQAIAGVLLCTTTACTDVRDEFGCNSTATIEKTAQTPIDKNTYSASFVLHANIAKGEEVLEVGYTDAIRSKFTPLQSGSSVVSGDHTFSLTGSYASGITIYPYVRTAEVLIYGTPCKIPSSQPEDFLTISSVTPVQINSDWSATLSATFDHPELMQKDFKYVAMQISTSPQMDNNVYEQQDPYKRGNYEFTIRRLRPQTTYYCRIICQMKDDAIKSDIQKFTTTDAIDLGLSVKWAPCNLTADDYDSSIGGTRYRLPYTKGVEDIDPAKDMATIQLGNGWRLPTTAEAKELENNCTWEWGKQEKIDGWTVTGPNGNSIFLPVTGYHDRWGTTKTISFFWLSDGGHISEASWFDPNTWVVNVLRIGTDAVGNRLKGVSELEPSVNADASVRPVRVVN